MQRGLPLRLRETLPPSPSGSRTSRQLLSERTSRRLELGAWSWSFLLPGAAAFVRQRLGFRYLVRHRCCRRRRQPAP